MKAVITIKDVGKSIDVKLEFDPSVTDETISHAANIATTLVGLIPKVIKGQI